MKIMPYEDVPLKRHQLFLKVIFRKLKKLDKLINFMYNVPKYERR